YLFIFGFAFFILYGLVRWTFGWEAEALAARPANPASQDLTLFLVLRAFASGCAALTGVEAVSDGVPAFKPPGARNARVVLAWLGSRGDRRGFCNGILSPGGPAALLLVVFGGRTHRLIPLYAVGVFLSFTLSQARMVRRWLVRRERGWRWRWWVNAVGAATTGLVVLVITVTKFTHGAWVVVLLIPLLVMMFLA